MESKYSDENALSSIRKVIPTFSATKHDLMSGDSKMNLRRSSDLEDEEISIEMGIPNPADTFLKHLEDKDFQAMHRSLEENKADLEYEDRIVFVHLLLIFNAEKEIENLDVFKQMKKKSINRDMRLVLRNLLV